MGGGIRLLGNRNDCERLYQAMDLLLLPSRYEGFGIVTIEAQARGLQVIASTNIPDEAKISDGLRFLPLGVGAQAWAETALKLAGKVNLWGECMAEYEIGKQAKKLVSFYEEIHSV